ncbi:hypothetical protein B0H34DRAFT_502405 [Crassisporium funariophilum]|nr:hypothetical protein B0H34DRAFT_502405 [Crassisporium funariophilum]
MSHYTNVLAERRFPLVGNTERPYYERAHLTSSQSHHWPQYYSDPTPQQLDISSQSDSFPTYITAQSYNPPWQNATLSPALPAPSALSEFPPPVNVHSNTFSPNAAHNLTDYPESSQRTILPSSPKNVDNRLQAVYSYKNDQPRSPSSHSSDYGGSRLWDGRIQSHEHDHYPAHGSPMMESLHRTLGDELQCSDSRQSSVPASISTASSSHPSVKVEPDDPDGCFIMELSSVPLYSGERANNTLSQALGPPTEVPLRATQASPEMRQLMGVFRLNPFAMHSGEGRGVLPSPWFGGEARPLEEEPSVFEFQLEIDDNDVNGLLADSTSPFTQDGMSGDSGPQPSISMMMGAKEESQLRSFSPSFDLHREDSRSDECGDPEQEDTPDHDHQSEWDDVEYCNRSEVDTSSTTHSVHTPSEARMVYNPLNEAQHSQSHPAYHDQTPPPSGTSWDMDPYQPSGEDHFPAPESVPRMETAHIGSRTHKLHTTTSHPYLRKTVYHHQASGSTSSTSSNSHPQTHTLPQLHSGFSLLHKPTHHQYSHGPGGHLPTFHGTLVPSPLSSPSLDMVAVLPNHRLDPSSNLSPSYMRSGRVFSERLIDQDDTRISQHAHSRGAGMGEHAPRSSSSSIYELDAHSSDPLRHGCEVCNVITLVHATI